MEAAGRKEKVARLGLIGAPSSAGAYAPGQERAPAAFRRHGLVSALVDAGQRVHDRGDTTAFRWRQDTTRPKAMNLEAVRRVGEELASRVSAAFAAGENVLVIGGDCTVELGTVAGALQDCDSVGLVYVDLDVDMNSPESSDGALDWTGVAHLLDCPGTEHALSGLGARRPMLGPDDILLFGIDNISPPEASRIETLAMEPVMLAQVKRDPVGAARRAVAWGARFERLLVHLDVDVMSFVDFPFAENVRRCDGLTLSELSAVLSPLVAAPNWRALTLTEVNPDHAPDEAESFRDFIGLLSGALSPVEPKSQ